jgi:hypothetical protein
MIVTGGNSELELNSGLFLFSKSPLFSSHGPTQDDSSRRTQRSSHRYHLDDSGFRFKAVPTKTIAVSPRMVEQVDLAPTLSALLGHPTPFTSLGTIISELFYIPFTGVIERYRASVMNTAANDATDEANDACSPGSAADSAASKSNEQRYGLYDLCYAGYRADPLAYQLHQNAIQVFSFFMSYFDDDHFMSQENDASKRTTKGVDGICSIPTEWNLPVICPCSVEVNPPPDKRGAACTPDADPSTSSATPASSRRGSEAMNPAVAPLHSLLTQAICSHRAYISTLVTMGHGNTSTPSCSAGDGVGDLLTRDECANPSKGLEDKGGDEVDMNAVRDAVYKRYLVFAREVLGFAR